MGKRAIIEALRHYFSTQPVLKAWLFGSFSRGEETKDSDVDIMVSLDKSKPIGLKFFGMWSDLEELFYFFRKTDAKVIKNIGQAKSKPTLFCLRLTDCHIFIVVLRGKSI